MKFHVVLLFFLSWTMALGQSKKEQIMAQQSKLDSLIAVTERQQEQLRTAQTRQVQLESEINELYRQRGKLVDRTDSLKLVATALQHRVHSQALRLRGRPVDSSDPLNGISLRRTVLCHFSSPTEPDRFDLEVHGTELPTSLFLFFIRAANGKELHRSEVQFIRPEELTLPDEALTCLITQRMAGFFSEERFRMALPDQAPQQQRMQGLNERTHIQLPEAVHTSIGPLPTGNVFLVERAPGNDLRAMFMNKLGSVMEIPMRDL